MKSQGYLEVIAGPMFSGKTEELIRQVKRAVIGKKNIQVFKHAIDTRYGKQKRLFSHAGISFECDTAKTAQEILNRIKPKTEIVGIDEAQWFGEELVYVIQTLLDQNKSVIVSGLGMTFDRQPFAPMPALMAMADKVTKLSAICSICGSDAVYHKRIAKDKPKDALITDPTLVSKPDLTDYQARCRKCFNK
jgi:thymidine kinase